MANQWCVRTSILNGHPLAKVSAPTSRLKYLLIMLPSKFIFRFQETFKGRQAFSCATIMAER